MFSTLLSTILIINELMASNAGSVISPAINFDSWIELYNPSDQAVNLGGMYLSDNPDSLTLWQMPKNMGSVPAKGYTVVWLGSSDIKSNQAPFHLDCDGGTICLSDADGTLIERYQYPKALSRTAWARKTDGGEEWGWTATATPGKSNATSAFADKRLNPPVVSTDSKLFKSSVQVSVSIPEGAILMYTTDGSLPVYPVAAGSSSQQSKTGQFSFSKTTNLCLRLFQEGALPSVPVTRSYIKTSNQYTLPVISIVGDKKYFTDPKIGFDCDGDGTNGKTGNGQTQPKNYNQDWDRPVNFSYLTPEGEMLFNQDVNICASGGFTRSQRYRSFKLKSNKVFDGQNRFDYSFFPQKPYIRNKTLLIRNGGNDVWVHNARFMDPALETVIQRSGINVDVQSYVPVIEYVNGELRGVLNMREPNNDKFAYANWGYDDEELDAFENEEMKNGDDVVIKRIFELGRKATDDAAYDELKTLLDIDEYTNYMAVTLFLHNDDWPDNNIKAYRSRNGGRYRFVSFDLDYAFKGCWSDSDPNPFTNFVRFKDDKAPRKGLNKEFVNLFLDLMGRADFRCKFIDTFCLVGGSVFEPTRAGKIVDELLATVRPMCQMMKQQGINDGHDPDRAASTIKTNLQGRSQKMVGYLKSFSYARLSNSAQSVTLASDTEGAHLYVNNLDVPYASFKGHLFAPVTLRAEAPAGYRFAGWKKGSAVVGTEAEMALPAGTVNLTATFTKLTDNETAAQGLTPVRINEVSAANEIYVNEYFKRNDWVELYNTTDKAVDVEGMYLTDDPKKPQKYKISKESSSVSTVIPAHGYLVVWCDKLIPVSGLHAQFKLENKGGDVMLIAADGSWSDKLTYVEHHGDQTVGRYPDGTSEVLLMNTPTIAGANKTSSYVVPVEVVTGISDLMADQPSGSLQGEARAEIYTLAGQRVTSLNQIPSGPYIVRYTDDRGNSLIHKAVKR